MTGNSGKRKLAFIGILIVNFMTMFLICGVGVYGYSVAGYFDSIASVGMIFTLESVARCVAIPISGKLSDKAGHRQLFLERAGTVYHLLCGGGLCPFLLGVYHRAHGQRLCLGTVRLQYLCADLRSVRAERRTRYSGIAQALSTVAMILGSPVAGILCAVNWRVQFYVSLPILAVGAIFCLIGLPNVPKQAGEHSAIDVGGCIATFVMLIPFSLAMNWGSTYGWTSPLLLTLLAVALAGLAALVLVERKAENPIYPAKLLGNKFYLAIFMVSLFYSLGNAANNYVPTYVQYVLGYNSTVAGFVTLPALVIATVLSVVFGSLAAKNGRYKGMTVFWVALLHCGRRALLGHDRLGHPADGPGARGPGLAVLRHGQRRAADRPLYLSHESPQAG